jgi:hypothetical protein
VNFGAKWWLGFGSGSYIRVTVKMAATLGLRSCIYKVVCE